MMYNKKHNEMKEEAIAKIIEALEDGYDGYYCDLFDEVFNKGWYIIGTHKAKEALREYDVFEAIELVQKFEDEQWGEVTTELFNPERLINMVWYIVGYEVVYEDMYDISVLMANWDNMADDETNEKIVEAMKELFNC